MERMFPPQVDNKSFVEIFQKVKLDLALLYPQDYMNTIRSLK